MGKEPVRKVKRTSAGLEIASRLEGQVGVLTLEGEARLEIIHGLDEAARALRAQGARHLVLSCAGLSFMDSASISSFLMLEKELRSGAGRLVLCALSRSIQRMFAAAGIGSRFLTAADERAAIDLASKPSA